jgi:hypothetical protein
VLPDLPVRLRRARQETLQPRRSGGELGKLPQRGRGGLRNEALAEAQAALALDPRSSLALQVVALVQWQHAIFGTAPHTAAAWQMGFAATKQAIALDHNDSNAYALKASSSRRTRR